MKCKQCDQYINWYSNYFDKFCSRKCMDKYKENEIKNLKEKIKNLKKD